jgi:predicted RNase H-like HicB family nuclease
MRYTVILEREADGGYVATVPALPGCVSQGDTRDEVMRNIREAADLYIEDCIAAGDPVPSEAGTPALSSRITGGFALEPCGRF